MNKSLSFVVANHFLVSSFSERFLVPSDSSHGPARKNLGYGRNDFDHAGERGGRSRWGVGFPQSYQLYSESVPEVLVFGRRL